MRGDDGDRNCRPRAGQAGMTESPRALADPADPAPTAWGRPTTLAAALVAAYRGAIYEFEWNGRRERLRLDHHSPALESLVRVTVGSSALLITACNPFGRPLSDEVNAARQADLAATLAAMGLSALAAQGRDPAGSWPPEPSFLVPGASWNEAIALGRRFDQNAVVWSGGDAVPRLVLLR